MVEEKRKFASRSLASNYCAPLTFRSRWLKPAQVKTNETFAYVTASSADLQLAARLLRASCRCATIIIIWLTSIQLS